jgi:hypothetical protein
VKSEQQGWETEQFVCWRKEKNDHNKQQQETEIAAWTTNTSSDGQI